MNKNSFEEHEKKAIITDNYFREKGVIFNRMRLNMKDKRTAIEKLERRTYQTKGITCSNASRKV